MVQKLVHLETRKIKKNINWYVTHMIYFIRHFIHFCLFTQSYNLEPATEALIEMEVSKEDYLGSKRVSKKYGIPEQVIKTRRRNELKKNPQLKRNVGNIEINSELQEEMDEVLNNRYAFKSINYENNSNVYDV